MSKTTQIENIVTDKTSGAEFDPRSSFMVPAFWIAIVLPALLLAAITSLRSGFSEITLGAAPSRVLIEASERVMAGEQLSFWSTISTYALLLIFVAVRWDRRLEVPRGFGGWSQISLVWATGIAAAVLGSFWLAHLFAVVAISSWLCAQQERNSGRTLAHLCMLPLLALGLPEELGILATNYLQDWTMAGASRLLDLAAKEHVPSGYLFWIVTSNSIFANPCASASQWLLITAWLTTLSCTWRRRSISHWIIFISLGYLVLFVLLPLFTATSILLKETVPLHAHNWSFISIALNAVVLVITLGAFQRLLNVVLEPIKDDFGVDNGVVLVWNFLFSTERVPQVDELHHEIGAKRVTEDKPAPKLDSRTTVYANFAFAFAISACLFLPGDSVKAVTKSEQEAYQLTFPQVAIDDLTAAIRWDGWQQVDKESSSEGESLMIQFQHLQLEDADLIIDLPVPQSSQRWLDIPWRNNQTCSADWQLRGVPKSDLLSE